MEKYIEHCPADRYLYDFGLCSTEKGFAQIDTSEDAWYYGTWANPDKMIVFNYCEGDCYTTICDSIDDFKDEIMSIKESCERRGHRFKGIDPGLNKESIKKWLGIFPDLFRLKKN